MDKNNIVVPKKESKKMYFIPRNNKIYNYIAHTSVRNRYLCTGFFVASMTFVSLYFMQRFITVYSVLYSQELAILQKKYQEQERLERKNHQLVVVIDETKQDFQKNITTMQAQEYFKKQLLFVLDIIKNAGLQLHSYGVQKEKNKNWYKKEIAHFDITGSYQQIVHFLENLKNSQKMIVVSQWSLVRVEKDIFHLRCDVEFVLINQLTQSEAKGEKKSLQLLSKLKG